MCHRTVVCVPTTQAWYWCWSIRIPVVAFACLTLNEASRWDARGDERRSRRMFPYGCDSYRAPLLFSSLPFPFFLLCVWCVSRMVHPLCGWSAPTERRTANNNNTCTSKQHTTREYDQSTARLVLVVCLLSVVGSTKDDATCTQ